MRLRAILFAGAAFGLAGYGAWQLSEAATTYFELESQKRIAEALTKAGEGWVSVDADGLEIVLNGQAPDEATRFRAVELARRSIDPSRIVDRTEIASPEPLDPPSFALELLRNGTEVSMIGLVPVQNKREIETARMIRNELAQTGQGLGITDMLETAEHPEPEGWHESLAFALDVLATLPRAKISVEPGQVEIIAVADSIKAKEFLEQRLHNESPDQVELTLDISAPRPIITPFELTYSHSGEKGKFEKCSAENEDTVSQFAAAAANLEPDALQDCSIGLGAPNSAWTDVAVAGIAAVQTLGEGEFRLSDTQVILAGAEGTELETFKAVATDLAAALPDGYSFERLAPQLVSSAGDPSNEVAVTFFADLEQDGRISLNGTVKDETSRQAILSYTTALFGHDMVTDQTVVSEAVPEGWPGRVFAGLDALHEIKEGRLSVTPTVLDLRGWGVSLGADKRIENMLGERVEHANVEIRFDAEAAAAEARARKLASMSRSEICSAEVSAILDAQSIEFKPGSAEISPESRGVIAAIADVLRSCPGAQFEVAGHTDSQGKAEVNRTLSTKRAEAVRNALEEEDLPLILFRSRGYGAEYPIDDNATEAGRRKNRRIEMTLFRDAPAPLELGETDAQLSPTECAARISELLNEEAIEFDVGASQIKPSSQHIIADLADALGQCEGTSFEVSGHTDSLGRADLNRRISSERAEAVREALQAAGLPETVTLSSRGYGSENPIADNSTQEGRALNRRIEMHLMAPEDERVDGAESVEAESQNEGAPSGSN